MKKKETNPVRPPIVEELDIESLPRGEVTRLRLHIASNGMADSMMVPIIVSRGKHEGPIMGITAALHGNELNGLPVIFELLREIRPNRLSGTLVCVPVINIPGFLQNTRYFSDGQDLNRLFPGKSHGNCGEYYVHQFTQKFLRKIDYLIDLHTASFGRINSLYVRADMTAPVTAKMSRLQNPQIIVHNKGHDGTMRSAAADLDVPAICVEVGNPLRFQRRLIRSSMVGIHNVLGYLKMYSKPEKRPKEAPIMCGKSYWIYTDQGGVLEVLPPLTAQVEKGEVVARLRNVFGDIIQEYLAPEAGIVVGKSTNPVGEAGSRILHLGIIGEPRGVVPEKGKGSRAPGKSRGKGKKTSDKGKKKAKGK